MMNSSLESHRQEMSGRRSEEEFLLGYDRYRSDVYFNDESNLRRSPSDGTCLINIREGRESKKYLKKSCYFRIEWSAAIFLAAFMWRRPLNSVFLATATHRGSGGVSDGTGTQMRAYLIDKCRIKMVWRMLYNVRNPPWEGDREK